MKMIEAILKPHHLEIVHRTLCTHGIEGMTISDVRWHGRLYSPVSGPGVSAEASGHRVKVEILIPEELERTVIEALVDATWRDSMGDTPIRVTPVEEVVRVRTGERGEAAF